MSRETRESKYCEEVADATKSKILTVNNALAAGMLAVPAAVGLSLYKPEYHHAGEHHLHTSAAWNEVGFEFANVYAAANFCMLGLAAVVKKCSQDTFSHLSKEDLMFGGMLVATMAFVLNPVVNNIGVHSATEAALGYTVDLSGHIEAAATTLVSMGLLAGSHTKRRQAQTPEAGWKNHIPSAVALAAVTAILGALVVNTAGAGFHRPSEVVGGLLLELGGMGLCVLALPLAVKLVDRIAQAWNERQHTGDLRVEPLLTEDERRRALDGDIGSSTDPDLEAGRGASPSGKT